MPFPIGSNFAVAFICASRTSKRGTSQSQQVQRRLEDDKTTIVRFVDSNTAEDGHAPGLATAIRIADEAGEVDRLVVDSAKSLKSALNDELKAELQWLCDLGLMIIDASTGTNLNAAGDPDHREAQPRAESDSGELERLFLTVGTRYDRNTRRAKKDPVVGQIGSLRAQICDLLEQIQRVTTAWDLADPYPGDTEIERRHERYSKNLWSRYVAMQVRARAAHRRMTCEFAAPPDTTPRPHIHRIDDVALAFCELDHWLKDAESAACNKMVREFDDAHAGRAAIDEPPEPVANEPLLRRPRPAELRAADSYRWVIEKAPHLIPEAPRLCYTTQMLEFIVQNGCPAYSGLRVPCFTTWKRQVRGGLRPDEKHTMSPRHGRADGSHIIHQEDV